MATAQPMAAITNAALTWLKTRIAPAHNAKLPSRIAMMSKILAIHDAKTCNPLVNVILFIDGVVIRGISWETKNHAPIIPEALLVQNNKSDSHGNSMIVQPVGPWRPPM